MKNLDELIAEIINLDTSVLTAGSTVHFVCKMIEANRAKLEAGMAKPLEIAAMYFDDIDGNPLFRAVLIPRGAEDGQYIVLIQLEDDGEGTVEQEALDILKNKYHITAEFTEE